jgi:hypothetical protein
VVPAEALVAAPEVLEALVLAVEVLAVEVLVPGAAPAEQTEGRVPAAARAPAVVTARMERQALAEARAIARHPAPAAMRRAWRERRPRRA